MGTLKDVAAVEAHLREIEAYEVEAEQALARPVLTPDERAFLRSPDLPRLKVDPSALFPLK